MRGVTGLEDKPRTPCRHPNKLPFQVEKAILRIKGEYSTWGAPKIREKLIEQMPGEKPTSNWRVTATAMPTHRLQSADPFIKSADQSIENPIDFCP